MSKKIIALDIGGVCLNVRPERCFGLLGFKNIEEIPLEVFAGIDNYEKGRISTAEFVALFKRQSSNDLPDDFLRSAWNAMLGEPIDGIEQLVRELLARGHRIVFFSDTSPLHMEKFKAEYPVASLVKNAIFSFIAGAKKPEPPMYMSFEADYGKPDLYIDDRQLCLDGGVAAGWPVCRFTSPAALREKLTAESFL